MATHTLALDREGSGVHVQWDGEAGEEFTRVLLQHSIDDGAFQLTYDETAFTGSGRTYWHIKAAADVDFDAEVKFCVEVFTLGGNHYWDYLSLEPRQKKASKTFDHGQVAARAPAVPAPTPPPYSRPQEPSPQVTYVPGPAPQPPQVQYAVQAEPKKKRGCLGKLGCLFLVLFAALLLLILVMAILGPSLF